MKYPWKGFRLTKNSISVLITHLMYDDIRWDKDDIRIMMTFFVIVLKPNGRWYIDSKD